MRNLCMKVSYEGTAYSGFQTQPRARTVQAEIEQALSKITGEPIVIVSSGRTDAGVHAHGQVFNFLTKSRMELKRWCLAVNNILPRDIVVVAVKEVPLDFHARKAASRKTYRYTINNYRYVDVFSSPFQYHHPTPLNVEAMQEAIGCLIGEHDFTSFCSARSTKQSHVRMIYKAKLEAVKLEHRSDAGQLLYFDITGNGFLYHMVRIIAGTLLSIGEGKLSSADMKRILLARDRGLAGPTAAAQGLSLWEVSYDDVQF